ncbi:hypothetical protein DFH07DRAFT_954128 [Mycena maculata]|uniref:Uncharacterized protein n=1 Tax=Mycena maculata TaxID=230809 RepID=A0AAD7NPR6_9AGAR|nr:hypothetical protein DFH07DRAFT_954128 [Mycena maculata]
MSVAPLTLPMFIGTVVNWALFGTLLVQTYIYFGVFPKDPRLSKLVVVAVLVLEVVETMANSRDVICIFGAGWGNMYVVGLVAFQISALMGPRSP